MVRHRELNGRYQVLDLHAYASHERGAYWFTGGFGLRALGVWAVSTTVGLLWSSTSLYEGPLAKVTKGIDLSFISAFVIGGILYFVLGRLAPASAQQASRPGPVRETR
jgi:purine-cytosine permease-like protein